MSDEQLPEGWTVTTWTCDECPQTVSANTYGDASGGRLVHRDSHQLVFPAGQGQYWLMGIPTGTEMEPQ